MAHEMVMPQLGLSMDSGQIARWLKQTGDLVRAGEVLLEVESDKATVEVEAPAGGVLHILLGPEDGEVAVGAVIAHLLEPGEAAPDEATAAPPAQAQVPAGRPPSSPAARRRARELGVDWRLAPGTGPRGRILERDVAQLAAARQAAAPQPAAAPAASITPVARRMAEAAGLDVEELAHRHPGRRLERADVEQALRAAGARPQPAAPPDQHAEPTPGRRVPVGRLRRVIAERMAHSAHTTAAVTLTTEADASEMVRIREELKADPQSGVVPSYNAILAKLAARALLEHPALNASLDGDQIVYWETANIAVAVDTERGLVVPVFRDVQKKSVRELASEMEQLLPRAREGKATPDELTGSTFTITNLGQFEVDAFTPIINPPECAVLGVGRLVDKWVVIDRAPAIRTMLTLSLSFDHRLVDGAPAARFLQRMKQLIEHPIPVLV